MIRAMLSIVLIAGMCLSVGSCNKLSDTTWVYYDETYCADPWGFSSVPVDEKEGNVEEHLAEKGIAVLAVEVIEDAIAESCFSCGCRSGKRIKCQVDENDVSDMEDEGFYQ